MEVQRRYRLCVSPIQFVTCGPLSLPAACGSLWTRPVQPTAHIDVSCIEVRGPMSRRWWELLAGSPSAPANKIGLMSSGRCTVWLPGQPLFDSSVGVHHMCVALVDLLSACAFGSVLPVRRLSQAKLVEPRRLELLTPSLQRRCSPN